MMACDDGNEAPLGPSQPTRNLHTAIAEGDVEGVRASVAAGADVNGVDEDGVTPLAKAAAGGRLDIVETLIRAGADANIGSLDPTGSFKPEEIVHPFMVSALSGHHEVFKRLARSTRPKDRLKGIKRLTAHRMKRNRKLWRDPDVRSLHEAAESGDSAAVAGLIARMADVDMGDNFYDNTPLTKATRCGHREVVRLLLDAGARPNGFGGGALSLAPDADIAGLLLRAGADPNDFDFELMITPLNAAAVHDRPDVASLLIDAGAEINALTEPFGCALSAAIGHRSRAVARLLIERGADVNLRKKRGWPPLMYAAWKGQAEIVRLLLDAGADPGFEDGEGETPRSLAEERGDIEVVRWLDSYGDESS